MKPKNTSKQPKPAATPEARKRFRLEKLEERIAPALHQNPQTKWVGGGGGNGTVSGTGTIY